MKVFKGPNLVIQMASHEWVIILPNFNRILRIVLSYRGFWVFHYGLGIGSPFLDMTKLRVACSNRLR